jgi:hypothetical protein
MPHARVWFSHHACDTGTLRVILTPACYLNNHAYDFHTHACDFHTHACDLNTHACDFDTLCVKLLYYNIYINLSCRPFEKLSPACVSNQHTARHCNRIILRVELTCKRDNSTCMRADSTRMRVQNLYFNMIDIFSS